MIYALLTAPSRDGHWWQFAQTDPRLLAAFIEEPGLKPLLANSEWAGFPRFGEQSRRSRFWELMIEEVGRRTLAEWQQIFDANPNVSAELFRHDAQALDHPQLQHDGRTVTVDDPGRGPVRRPSALP